MGQGEKPSPSGRELTAGSGFASIDSRPNCGLFDRHIVATDRVIFMAVVPGAHASSWWYYGSHDTGEAHLPA
jgi:hypothetical protein